MFFNKVHIQVKGSEDRLYDFCSHPNAPLGEIHDALVTMRAYVLQKMKEQSDKEQQNKELNQEEEDAEQKRAESCEDGIEE